MNKQAESHLGIYRRLLSYVFPYWKCLLIGAIATFLLSSLDAGFTWLIKPIVNKGFIHRDVGFIQLIPWLVLGIFVFRGLFSFGSNYYITRAARNLVMDFRQLLFKKALQLPASYYDQNSSGKMLSMMLYNVEQITEASTNALLTILKDGSFAIGLLVVMLLANWKLTMLFALVAPIIVWVVKICSKRMRRISGEIQDSVAHVTHVAEEMLQGYKIVRLYNAQDHEENKFNQATHTNRQQELKIQVTNSLNSWIVQMVISMPIVGALYYATMPSHQITAGSMASIIVAMVSFSRPVRRLSGINPSIQKGIAAAASIFKILDQSAEKDTGKHTIDRVKGEIIFKNVNFHYARSEQKILQGINLHVAEGETVALVGQSGAGKSTLVNLLPRFYNVTGGDILLDGVSLNDYSLASLRHQFAFVSQHTILFNDTIAKNIAYGAGDDVGHDAIVKAAESAYAMEFIRQLPEGLNSRVGEHGVLLSGGQRQRIAIARALLRQAPVLILDEATASLDSKAEKHIQAALDDLMHQHTSVVIAHRLSTIENADKIAVMEQGQIVEFGTHQDLLDLKGLYAQLHQMQFQGIVAKES